MFEFTIGNLNAGNIICDGSNISGNTGSYFRTSNVSQGNWSGESFFGIAPTRELNRLELDNIENFNLFIESRVLYLKSLRHLGDNWMSGKSKAPTSGSLKAAKDFLRSASQWYSANVRFKSFAENNSSLFKTPPKIVMGPTPQGGISVDFRFGSTHLFMINFYEESIELEAEIQGHYIDIPVEKNTVLEKIASHMSDYSTTKY